jgi:hypothetical protein
MTLRRRTSRHTPAHLARTDRTTAHPESSAGRLRDEWIDTECRRADIQVEAALAHWMSAH